MKAKQLNRLLARGAKAAERLEPKLEAVVASVLRSAAREAAEAFSGRATPLLTAAAPGLTPASAMVCLYMEPDEAAALAVMDDGEPASILHVTLCFLGEVDEDAYEAVLAAVETVASLRSPLSGTVGGLGTFGAYGEDEALYPSIALPDVVGLTELHVAVTDALDSAGIEYATTHGFCPHTTLAYRPDPTLPPAELLGLPLTFRRLSVARGDVPYHFPLGAPAEEVYVRSAESDAVYVQTAAGELPPNWVAPSAEEILSIEALVSRLRTKTDPIRLAAAKALMGPALEGAGLSFDVENPLVGKALAASSRNITSIVETTRALVMESIAAAYSEGLSIPDTAKVIRSVMFEAAGPRATLIARTEMAGVVNASSLATTTLVSNATGLSYMKRWMTAPGAEHPRHEDYEDLEGQTVGLDEMFDVAGAALEYPGDPGGPPEEVCNCRCTMDYVEMGADGEEIEAAALPSRSSTEGGTMRGQMARNRRRAKRARARGAQGVSKALSATTSQSNGSLPAAFVSALRRGLVLESLAAAGVEASQVQSTYEMAIGTLAEQKFYDLVMAAGFTETRGAGWPCEAELADHGEVLFRGEGGAVFRLTDGTLVLAHSGDGWFHARVASDSRPKLAAALDVFVAGYPPLYRDADDDGTVPVTFWTYGRFGPQSRLRRIESASWSDVEANYPGAVRAELARLIDPDFVPGEGGQLLLWQGPPGTGKTWALRVLASEWADWAEFHYITDPDAFFVSAPDYMVDVLLHETYEELEPSTDEVVTSVRAGEKWRVLILEDTGELLSARAKESQGQGLSRLLNVVDGMVGQGLRVLALVTTNDELGELHPAVTRPGRCASQLAFGALSAEESEAWLNAQPLQWGGTDVDEPMTLAELYARTGSSAEAFVEDGAECSCGHLAEQHEGDDNDGACSLVDCSCEAFSNVRPGDDDQEASAAATAHVESGGLLIYDNASAVANTSFTVGSKNAAMGVTVDPPAAPVAPAPAVARMTWEATFAPEGLPTDDGRIFAPGAISWRELPLTLMAQLETQDGHEGAVVCGRIDEIWRDGNFIRARGIFDDSEIGNEVARMVGEGVLRGLSVDLAIREAETAAASDFIDEAGNWREGERVEREPTDPWDLLEGEDDGEGYLFVIWDAVIGTATVCSFPAFAEAEIALTASGDGLPFAATLRHQAGFVVIAAELPVAVLEVECADCGLTAAAAGLAPLRPPVEWFDPPVLEGPTPLTVTAEGRIYGHAATWGVCHIGFPDTCIPAPHSSTEYRLFALGEILCEGGEQVAVGKITLGTGHAGRGLGAVAAAAHYDNTGTAVADVVAGEDEFGIWVAGALRPSVSEERVRELRAAVLSGDWRAVDGNLELVALLAVNVPGFPVPRPRLALAASGEIEGMRVMALTAANIVTPAADLSEAAVRARLAGLADVARGGFAALVARARG